MSVQLDELIINCVRDNPCLFEKTNKDYKNNHKKKEVWAEIAKTATCALGISVTGNFL